MHYSRIVCSIFLALLIASVSVPRAYGAPAEEPSRSAAPPRVTGHYSDFQYFPDSGDVGGTEVFLLYGDNKLWALLQVAEGWPGEPVLVEAKATGQSITFPFPQFGTQATFSGQVTAYGLEGTIQRPEGPVPLKLPRRNTFWQSQ